MTDSEAIKLALEFDRDMKPISGRVCRVDEAAWRLEDEDDVWHFTGWVELTRALDDAVAETSERTTSEGEDRR